MKDKNIAGILALFFGFLGIHRFYLGQVGLGILYAVLFMTGVSAILGLIDAIVFFSMDKDAFDIKYNKEYYRATKKRDTDFDRREYQRRERKQQPERREYPSKAASRTRYPEIKRSNPFKTSGIKKFKEYDYDEAIKDFEKALEIDPKDVAIHFNLACAYSINEQAEKAFYHLDKAVEHGFDDFKRIKEHDALAYVRIQKTFDDFEKNGFRLAQTVSREKEETLDINQPSADLLEQLKKLGDLREKGLLTEEEFVAQKRKLLG